MVDWKENESLKKQLCLNSDAAMMDDWVVCSCRRICGCMDESDQWLLDSYHHYHYSYPSPFLVSIPSSFEKQIFIMAGAPKRSSLRSNKGGSSDNDKARRRALDDCSNKKNNRSSTRKKQERVKEVRNVFVMRNHVSCVVLGTVCTGGSAVERMCLDVLLQWTFSVM